MTEIQNTTNSDFTITTSRDRVVMDSRIGWDHQSQVMTVDAALELAEALIKMARQARAWH